MTRRRLAAVLALGLSAACSRELSVPQPTPPVLSVRTLGPNPARAGDVVVAEYEVSAEPLSCQAILGPLFSTCAVVPPRTCRCTAVVPDDIAESVYAANLSARSLGGETRIFEPLGVDQRPPRIVGARISFTQRPSGWTVSALPAAVVDSISGTAALRLYAAASGGAPLATLAPAPDGSIAASTFAGVPPAGLWVEAEDRVGHVARVRAGAVDVVAGLAGRTRFQPSPVHLAPYFFDADYDPTLAWPGVGALVAGEAPAAAAAGAAAMGDSVESVTTAVAETANVVAPAWTPLAVPSTPFVDGRGGMNGLNVPLAHDPARRRTVLFGGVYSSHPCFGTASCTPDQVHPAETWEFDGETWTSLHVPGPSRRYASAIAYDPARGRVVLFGGGQIVGNATTNRANDTWEWDGATWTEIVTPTRPSGRAASRLVYDPARGELLLHGGNDGTSNCDGGFQLYCTGTWRYDGRDWTLLSSVAPSPSRNAPVAVWSPVTGDVVLHGGSSTASPNVFGDFWSWSGAWTKLVPTTALNGPPHGAAYDFARLTGQFLDPRSDLGGTMIWGLAETNGASITATHAFALGTNAGAVLHHPARRLTYATGDAAGMWVLDQRTPHPRTATHAFALDLAQGAALSSLSVTWSGSGSGAAGSRVRLHAWNWAARRWDLVGDRTGAGAIAGSPPGAAADYASGRRVWVMASAPASGAAGGPESRLATDFVEVRASYTLP